MPSKAGIHPPRIPAFAGMTAVLLDAAISRNISKLTVACPIRTTQASHRPAMDRFGAPLVRGGMRRRELLSLGVAGVFFPLDVRIAWAAQTLLNVSYDPTRRFYTELNKAF